MFYFTYLQSVFFHFLPYLFSMLPDTLITCQQYARFIGFYRQHAAMTLCREDDIPSGIQNYLLVCLFVFVFVFVFLFFMRSLARLVRSFVRSLIYVRLVVFMGHSYWLISICGLGFTTPFSPVKIREKKGERDAETNT